MRKAANAKNWITTPLGDVKEWPQSLTTAFNICLNTKSPMLISWGKHLIKLYNDEFWAQFKIPGGQEGDEDGILPEVWAFLNPALEQVMNNGKAENLNNQQLELNDSICFFNFSFTPVPGDKDGVGGVFVSITPPADAQHTAQQVDTKIRHIFDQIPIGIGFFREPQHIVKYANQQLLQIWQRTSDQVENKPAAEVFPEITGQGYIDILNKVYREGAAFMANETPVTLHRNKKKETIYLNFSYEPFREENGRITGILVAANEVTGIIRSRHVLQESEKQFRNLIIHSPVAMCILKGKEMVVELANDAMLAILGKEGMNIEGMELLKLLPELKDQKFPGQLNEVFNKGTIFNEKETRVYINKDHGPVEYLLNYRYTPLIDAESNSVIGVMVTATDVTEQVKTHAIIEESENRYRQLVQGLPLALYTCDAEGKILLYNDSAVDLWGREPEKNKDRWCGSWRIYEPDGKPLPLNECPMAIALKNGRPMREEIVVERPDGQRVTVQANAQPFFDSEGKVAGAVNMLIDITERKRSEYILRESEQRFKKVADTAPAMIWMTDVNRQTYFFNRAWLKFTGKTLEEETGRGWEKSVHPGDRNTCRAIAGKAFDAHKEYYMEYRLKRNDGKYRWVAESAVPRFDSQNVFEGYIGSCMDIHDKKMAARLLEKKVSTRTKDLKKANEFLEKMNEELTSFAYISSHDLQEPLRKIQTFISRITELEKDNLSDKGIDYFERIENASMRMQQLIEDLLAYSRTNTDEKYFEKVHLKKLVEDVRYDLSEKIEEKNAVIKTMSNPAMKVVQFQFHQLFTNLISNALKFSKPEVQPVITITAEELEGKDINEKGIDKDKSYHHVTVNDNGIGFEQKYSKRIFELFQRLHGRNEYRGTGIGLAICKKIMDNHEGVITAEGKKGVGTTFHIYLPLEPKA